MSDFVKFENLIEQHHILFLLIEKIGIFGKKLEKVPGEHYGVSIIVSFKNTARVENGGGKRLKKILK